MLKGIFYLFLILILPFQFSMAQNLNEKDKSRIDRANEIVKQAREAIYQGIKRENIKSLFLKSEATAATDGSFQIEGDASPHEIKSRQTAETSVSIELPNKISQKVFGYDPNKNSAENYVEAVSIINGEKFSVVTDTVIDGKAFDANAIFNAPYMPESLKKQMKEAQEKLKPTREGIQAGISNQLFAVLLSPLWGDDKVFVYVGKAETDDNARADILEVESNSERQTRYFFDEKTHLLLMIIDEISKNGVSAKTTQYFSDYRLIDGLIIAKRINTETESINNMPEMEIMGKRTKMSGKSKTITETIVKDFKINPIFKPEIFVVKETAVAKEK